MWVSTLEDTQILRTLSLSYRQYLVLFLHVNKGVTTIQGHPRSLISIIQYESKLFVCDFLLAINNNLGAVLHCFGDTICLLLPGGTIAVST